MVSFIDQLCKSFLTSYLIKLETRCCCERHFVDVVNSFFYVKDIRFDNVDGPHPVS